MAEAKPKKKTTAKAETPVEETPAVVEEATQAESIPVAKEPAPTKDAWEVKDKTYQLIGKNPLTFKLRCKKIFWYDEEKGYERELLYSRNQRTIFKDEMVGKPELSHVIFKNGVLFVPKELQVLQKLLAIHPGRDVIFFERDAEKVAASEIDTIDLQTDALVMARDMDLTDVEAILRVEKGSAVSNMSSQELKRDIRLFAKNNPKLFMDLAKDPNVRLRNTGIKAVEVGLIRLSNDNRYFEWASNNRKLFTIPFNENPYSALAAWFKTDEGVGVLNTVEKSLA